MVHGARLVASFSLLLPAKQWGGDPASQRSDRRPGKGRPGANQRDRIPWRSDHRQCGGKPGADHLRLDPGGGDPGAIESPRFPVVPQKRGMATASVRHRPPLGEVDHGSGGMIPRFFLRMGVLIMIYVIIMIIEKR